MNTHEFIFRTKIFKFFTPVMMGALLVLIASCTPTIHYLGDSYQPTAKVDIYYDEKDVTKDYRTMGKMSHGNMMDFEMETIRNKMIEKAKASGADGIIFMEVKNVVDVHNHEDDVLLDNDRLSITANLIKYKN